MVSSYSCLEVCQNRNTDSAFRLQLSIAYLKEKPANQASATPSTPTASGVRSAAARLLGAGNGSRALSFVGGNGANRVVSGSSKIGGSVGTSVGSSSSQPVANYDGKGTYLIFNTADTLFISDLNSQDKVLISFFRFAFIYFTQLVV